MSTTSHPEFIPLPQDPQQPAKSIRFTAPTDDIKWDASLGFMNGNDERSSHRFKMEIKKFRPGAHFYPLKVYSKSPTEPMINHRIGNKWLDNGGQATIYVNNNKSSLTIIFQNPNEQDKTLIVELTDPEVGATNRQ